MQKLQALILTFVSLVMSPSVFAQARGEEATARREYLSNLGFNDITKEIRTRREAGLYETELNRRQMVMSEFNYEAVNSARELSISILDLSHFARSEVSSERGAQFARFAAKMLALKPLSPPTDYPSEIRTIKDDAAREEAMVQWLHKERVRQMKLQKDRVVSDIVSLIYKTADAADLKEVKRIDKLVNTIIERMYLDDTTGGGRLFGRSLTGLLLREELLHGDTSKPITAVLKNELEKRYSLFLENFFGDTLKFQTPKGPNEVKVVNGTMMLTRYMQASSLEISVAAVPGRFTDRMRARWEGLIGHPLSVPLFMTPERAEDGITLGERLLDWGAQARLLREGVSHIVYLFVLEDPKTGIKTVRVIDNYPSQIYDMTGEYVLTGGVRLTFIEQAIDSSHHSSVYFAFPDAKKLQAWSQQNLRENGYQPEFLPSADFKLDGTKLVLTGESKSFKTAISREEFYKLHSEKDPEVLSQNIMKAFQKDAEEKAYLNLIFHWVDPLGKTIPGGGYCSLSGDIFMRSGAGMSIEQRPSDWHPGLKLVAKVGKFGAALQESDLTSLQKVGKRLQEIPFISKAYSLTQSKIVSPTSLAVQPFMNGRMVYFRRTSPEQRAQSPYLSNDYREADPKLTEQLQKKIELTEMGTGPTNFSRDYSAAIRNIEFIGTKAASLNEPQVHYDEQRIAQTGSKKEAQRKGYVSTEDNVCNKGMKPPVQ